MMPKLGPIHGFRRFFAPVWLSYGSVETTVYLSNDLADLYMNTVHIIVAARPNFMKVSPLFKELDTNRHINARLVHTGQHYDHNMSEAFFQDLHLPDPYIHLGIGSGSHAQQTGGVLMAYGEVLERDRPDATIVVGDVNSTAACALACTKLQIPTIHLEAGLRSGDRGMPEEINRVVTDSIADLLWTPSKDADENLSSEGVPEERIEFVGNIMIDCFVLMREKILNTLIVDQLGVAAGEYGIVTLHRPSNVDDTQVLAKLVKTLVELAKTIQLVFPVHPRTESQLRRQGLWSSLEETTGIRLLKPLGYLEFMRLVMDARLVVTDSGGIQEETTYLGIPCLTLRENTERPVTITHGTNRLVRPSTLLQEVNVTLDAVKNPSSPPEYWDGQTAMRCVTSLMNFLKA